MADLAEIKTGVRDIEILHPATGKMLGVRVSLLSIDDAKLEPLKRKFLDSRLQLERRNKGFKASDIEANKRELLFSAITGWQWYKPDDADEPATFKGEMPDLTRKNVMEVFAELPWFMDQLNEEVADTKAFFQL